MTIEISSEDPRPIRAIEIAAGASNSGSDNHAPSRGARRQNRRSDAPAARGVRHSVPIWRVPVTAHFFAGARRVCSEDECRG